MDFTKFKARRGGATEALKKIKDMQPTFNDDRFWYLTRDAGDYGEAIIRFLPMLSPEEVPWNLTFRHSFKENNKWFIENCPTTIGQPCPSCDYAQPYWDEDTEQSKEIARRYWRKKEYIYNILVVNDPNKESNNGKVFLFKAGQTIHDKILEKIQPKGKLDKPIWIFDLWEGLNFKMTVKKKSGYFNYDDSQFYMERVPVAETDEEIEKLYSQIRDLNEFTEPKRFKDYDVLAKKFKSIVRDAGKSILKQKLEEENTIDNNITFDDDNSTEPQKSDENTVVEKDVVNKTASDELGDDFDFDSLTDDDFNFDN